MNPKITENIKIKNIFNGFEENNLDSQVLSQCTIKKYNINSKNCKDEDFALITNEYMISLVINDKAQISLQCTPSQLEALTIGYLFCEGFINNLNEIEGIDYKKDLKKIFIWINENNVNLNNISQKTEIRSSGCVGIKIQYAEIKNTITSNIKISPEIIFKSLKKIHDESTIWKKSGGTHISGLFSKEGSLISVAEDIGRHNTIDKIVGEGILKKKDLSEMFVVTSGRISAASVAKLARVGIPILISNTTALNEGLILAKKINMSIIGFAREPLMNIYNGIERIKFF